MRKLTLLLLMTFLLAGSSFAKEPVGDWQTVQNDIPRGWQITVVTAFAFPCIFEQANDEELVCEQLHHRWGSENNDIHVLRDRIREIRVEKREGANMLAGGIGGGAEGGLLGVVAVAHGLGPAALLLGLRRAEMGDHTASASARLPCKRNHRGPA